MIAVCLRVPLWRIINKAVVVILMAGLFNLFEHRVLFLKRFPFASESSCWVQGWDDDFSLAKFAD
jgi:hypothetical protein